MNPNYAQRASTELTDRYVVTFRDNDDGEGMQLMRNQAGLRDLVHTRDFDENAVGFGEVAADDGTMFDELNICVVNCPAIAASRIASHAPTSSILAIEPVHKVFAMSSEPALGTLSQHYIDTANETWGLTATNCTSSQFTGKGIDIAILDTGIDAEHADFSQANLARRHSFLTDADAHDRNGHGTHCAGILAGSRQPEQAPTYGIAPDANLFVAKVLDDEGSGDVRSILGGLNWAIAHRCRVVSLSLGASFSSPAVMFEEAGKRALKAGTLVVAAAGNNANRHDSEFGFVVRPANSRFVLAVGAVDRKLQLARFSSRSSIVSGGEVDIVAPGVEVFSSWTGPERYRALSGTSMAVPFVAGIATLCAEATGARGRDLWKHLLETALRLPHPTVDAGAGLIQAV